jgi:hypothetical protein
VDQVEPVGHLELQEQVVLHQMVDLVVATVALVGLVSTSALQALEVSPIISTGLLIPTPVVAAVAHVLMVQRLQAPQELTEAEPADMHLVPLSTNRDRMQL